MKEDEKTTKFKADYKGETYYFSAPGCKKAFEDKNQSFLHEPLCNLAHNGKISAIGNYLRQNEFHYSLIIVHCRKGLCAFSNHHKTQENLFGSDINLSMCRLLELIEKRHGTFIERLVSLDENIAQGIVQSL